MRKLFISLCLFLLLLLPRYSLAQNATPACDPASTETNLCNPVQSVGGDSLQSFIVHILQVFGGAAGITTVVFVTFSGFRFLISQGNTEDVEAAKRGLQWSLSGLVVILLSYVLISALRTSLSVNEISPDLYGKTPALTNPIGATTFNDIYVLLLDGLFGFIGILGVFILVVNGVRYITARGDDEQTEKAKSGITYAVLGLAISALAYVIVRATATFFGAK